MEITIWPLVSDCCLYFVGKVLKTALSIYCDLNQPNPSLEEVVICTPQTTTEEVSLEYIVYIWCNEFYLLLYSMEIYK